jgi:ADP-heptose:LPS heptosyltransferase
MFLKRLERWWRSLWIRMLVGLMRRPVDGRPDWTAKPFRALFLRHDRAGDMIVSTGVMRGIVQALPNATLDVLASPINATILDEAAYVHDVIVFDKKRLSSYLPTARRLRRANYDVVIDCMVTAPSVTTLLLILASGARYRVGIAGRGNDDAFNITVEPESNDDRHMVDRIADLAGGLGVTLSAAQRQPVIVLRHSESATAESAWGPRGNGRRILINVSAGAAHRLWQEEKFVAVMEHIRRVDPTATFRVIGSPNERSRAEQVAAGGGGRYVETPTIRAAFALIASADFVLTPDTSITHATSAFQKPAVVLFGRGSATRWSLYGTIGENVENSDPTLKTLSVERVTSAVDAVWRRTTAVDVD